MPDQVDTQAPPGRAQTAQFMDRAVLVVEDEPFMAIDVALTFEGEGARTLHAANCAQAEHAIAAVGGPEGLIGAVLDIRLGEEETVRPIAERLRGANVAFVFHTALSDSAARRLAGVEALCVSKPSTPDQLVEALRIALAGREARTTH